MKLIKLIKPRNPIITYLIIEEKKFKEPSVYRIRKTYEERIMFIKVKNYWYVDKRNKLCQKKDAFNTISLNKIEEFKQWCEDFE
jgi:hypothetical protein